MTYVIGGEDAEPVSKRARLESVIPVRSTAHQAAKPAQPAPPPPSEPRVLSSGAIASFASLANQIEESPLRDALQNLLKHQSKI